MQEPSYHLEAVVKTRDELEDFTGPLDVILMLLAKDKIEIRDIRISVLLDQYLAYLDQMKKMDLEIASEFVQMASYLTYIKSRMLLAEEKEVTELETLVSALEQLQNRDALAAVREKAPELAERSARGMRLHVRAPSPLPDHPLDYRLESAELLLALAPVLLRGTDKAKEEPEPLRGVPTPIIYGIREKSVQLVRLLRENGRMGLRRLFALCKSRSELVATFLSVLELCSAGKLFVTRSGEDYSVDRADEGETNG